MPKAILAALDEQRGAWPGAGGGGSGGLDGTRNSKTTLIYANCALIAHELVKRAFGTSDATIGVRGETANTAERR